MNELPPKRRQIIRLKLKASDVRTATSSCIKGMNISTYSSYGTAAIVSPDKSNGYEEAKVEEGNTHGAKSRYQS